MDSQSEKEPRILIAIDQAIVDGYKNALTSSLKLLEVAFLQRDAMEKRADADRLLTIQEARTYLGGISEDTLLYYRNRYKLPFIKKGQGSTWYRKGDIDAWLEEGRVNRRRS